MIAENKEMKTIKVFVLMADFTHRSTCGKLVDSWISAPSNLSGGRLCHQCFTLLVFLFLETQEAIPEFSNNITSRKVAESDDVHVEYKLGKFENLI